MNVLEAILCSAAQYQQCSGVEDHWGWEQRYINHEQTAGNSQQYFP